MSVRRDTGFTLVEVMIALMIFGMIAAAGVALLAFSVRAQGASAVALDDTGALSRLSSILTADLAQAQDRNTRDVNGTLLPAFSGDAAATPLLRLVRAGWSNPDQAPRAELQKVEYRLAGDGLERVAYPALDGAAPLPPALLLDRVRTVQLRFRYRGAWSDTWQGNPRAALPQAIELVVTRADSRLYRLLFLVGTGAGRVQESGSGAQGGGGGGAAGGGTGSPGAGAPARIPGGGDAAR
ncbi:type II secretion system minor pseudopilin GspJ [Sphingomonas yunnanensis]|uniref:type II secretion system minor pseudopilin GspJ n=1 Tax=Sphingomonas yunnanensis TaxID=310400 RepID=UPI001CA7A341|nr:type II secretion system minor pseudopilin GspJ [Sphingomonas yunnanensis]MBY9061539.1 type II secretion system minor pseudopilin GspJ [Sphingomonas yunnanensis]